MTIDKLKPLLVKAFKIRARILILGNPGIGKTDCVEQAAQEVDSDLMTVYAALMDSVDARGMPGIIEVDGRKEAHFLPFGDLNRLIETKRPLICFWDELGQAAPAVQSSIMSLVLARRINGTKISDLVTFVAATNDINSNSFVSGIIEPLKSRWDSIIKVEADYDGWKSWAIKNDISHELIGFLKFRPALLSAFAPTKSITNSPSPRGWSSVDKFLKAGFDHNDVEIFKGSVGEGAAIEFCAHLRFCKDLPDIQEIIKNPDAVFLPDNLGVRYAVATALARNATENNLPNIIKYLHRFSPRGEKTANDLEALTIMDINQIPDKKKLIETKTIIDWMDVNSNLFLG